MEGPIMSNAGALLLSSRFRWGLQRDDLNQVLKAIGWAMDTTCEGATATLTCCSTDDPNLVFGCAARWGVDFTLGRSPRMLVASYRSFSWYTGQERGYVYRSSLELLKPPHLHTSA